MVKRNQTLEFGNLVCRFGEELKLIDLLEEIVLPAFLASDPPYVREFGKTRYFLFDINVVPLKDDKLDETYGIAGRLVKDTVLEREQIFQEGEGLVKNEEAIRSSPSSFFLLVLHNHRLLYVKETVGAPTMEQFSNTLESLFRQRRKDFIDEESKRRKAEKNEGSKKKDLQVEYPRPTVDTIPLTSNEEAEEFIKRFTVLKSLEFKLKETNDESDNDPFFEKFRQKKDRLNSSSSTMVHRNTKGLNGEVAAEEVQNATSNGTQKVTLKGEDEFGDSLSGNNKDFQIKRPLENAPTRDSVRSSHRLYEIFKNTINEGLVNVPEAGRRTRRIMRRLGERLRNGSR